MSSPEKHSRDRHLSECTCPTVEPPRFHPCGAWSLDLEDVEERTQQAQWPDNTPYIVRYNKSGYPGILSACKRSRREALGLFYNVNKFFFAGSHNRSQDRQVMNWLLASSRREQLKLFHHIEWYAPTDELGIRSYAVIIMLVELGILTGAVVRRSRSLIDLFPLPLNGPDEPWVRKISRFDCNSVMCASDDSFEIDRHVLCGLRLAVRERIKQKRIIKDAVLHGRIEEIEEMMSAVAAKWWRECWPVWCQRPCSTCFRKGRRIVLGEPILRGIPAREKDDVPGQSQTSAEDQGLPLLPPVCGTCKSRHWADEEAPCGTDPSSVQKALGS